MICQSVWYGNGDYNGDEWTGFEQTKVGYLTAGIHTIRVHGLAYGSADSNNTMLVFARISATAYDTNNANIQSVNQNAKNNQNNQNIVTPPIPNRRPKYVNRIN